MDGLAGDSWGLASGQQWVRRCGAPSAALKVMCKHESFPISSTPFNVVEPTVRLSPKVSTTTITQP